MFDASDAMLEIGAPALRIMSLAFIFAGISIVAGSSCQAFGYSVYSMFISIARQIVVLIPAAYLLSLAGVLRNKAPFRKGGAVRRRLFSSRSAPAEPGLHRIMRAECPI